MQHLNEPLKEETMHITDLVFHQKKLVLSQNELNTKKQVLITYSLFY